MFATANEFFDALPIPAVPAGRRRALAMSASWGSTRANYPMGLTPPAPLARLEHRLGDTEQGHGRGDLRPGGSHRGRTRPAVRGAFGGAASDRGLRREDESFPATRSRRSQGTRPSTPSRLPACPTLTAHVAFGPLARRRVPPEPSALDGCRQGVFLEHLRITARAQALARHLAGARPYRYQTHRCIYHGG